MTREDITFRSGGQTCAAWLYLPDGAHGSTPCVVMAHGFGGTREDAVPRFAERFVAAGLAALVFDYRHFGDSEGEPRQLLDIGLQLEDWTAAIACARTRPEIDETRIALWGSSFSGGHVVPTGARDGHVQAVISQAPFADGLKQLASFSLALNLKMTHARRCATSSVRCSGARLTMCRSSALPAAMPCCNLRIPTPVTARSWGRGRAGETSARRV